MPTADGQTYSYGKEETAFCPFLREGIRRNGSVTFLAGLGAGIMLATYLLCKEVLDAPQRRRDCGDRAPRGLIPQGRQERRLGGEAPLGLLLLGGAALAILKMPGKPVLAAGAAAALLAAGPLRKWARRRRRNSMLRSQLPDLLNLMANGLRAGFSQLQALELASREAPAPMKEELVRLLHQISFGLPLEQALDGFARRLRSEDAELAVTAMLIQRQTGGNLGEILDSVARNLRERARLAGKLRTLTAQGKLTGLVMASLPVGMAAFMILTAPDFIAPLFNTSTGRLLVGAAVAMEVVGGWLVLRLCRVNF